MNRTILFTTIFIFILQACAQKEAPQLVDYSEIVTGDQRINEYLPLIKNKTIGIVANQSSVIGNTHLVDTLLDSDIHLAKIFSPEHGFRGAEDAGAFIGGTTDPATGIQIISLYGKHKKPTEEDLEGVEVMLFDLQDVGVRFYTYISTLTYVMDACAAYGVEVIVLDRPNPNSFYVDGPILEAEFSSFVGMHRIPIVYGMTIGEYALLVNGEGWLQSERKCNLTVIKMRNYNRNMIVKLPVKPSPNLPNWQAVYLYPSLCLFEGTIMSIGRGTDFPFQVYGHPDFPVENFAFTPIPHSGAANPKYEGITCYGRNLTTYAENYATNTSRIHLTWLIESYKLLSPEHEFFTSYFDKLAGTDKLRKQIEEGMTEGEIRKSWESDLKTFKNIRKKYLLY
ncbi:MAG: DUF1343 domain-containing protein [Bacteroidetes bacterium]|nr:MAG: DUF1343 domain-containing protein [Bacteroidota bacterium]RLD73902.1 MAG: DUF1343 domain-containing protein [Bacteroidota bacterium]